MNEEIKSTIESIFVDIVNELSKSNTDQIRIAKMIRKCRIELGKIDSQDSVMPLNLSAEKGHKALLSGEFYETIELDNDEYCGCGKCDFCLDVQGEDAEPTIIQKVYISWINIKEIYRKIASHHGA